MATRLLDSDAKRLVSRSLFQALMDEDGAVIIVSFCKGIMRSDFVDVDEPRLTAACKHLIRYLAERRKHSVKHVCQDLVAEMRKEDGNEPPQPPEQPKKKGKKRRRRRK